MRWDSVRPGEGRRIGKVYQSCHGQPPGPGPVGQRGAFTERWSVEESDPGVSNYVLAGTALLTQTQCATAAGVKGGLTPLPPGGLFHEEPWQTTDIRFVVPALRTPSHQTACIAIAAIW